MIIASEEGVPALPHPQVPGKSNVQVKLSCILGETERWRNHVPNKLPISLTSASLFILWGKGNNFALERLPNGWGSQLFLLFV